MNRTVLRCALARVRAQRRELRQLMKDVEAMARARMAEAIAAGWLDDTPGAKRAVVLEGRVVGDRFVLDNRSHRAHDAGD